MKKFIFSALACVAFTGSSFASNEVLDKYVDYCTETMNDMVEFNKPCKIEVRAIDREGNSVTRYASGSGNISLSDCDSVRSRFEEDLRADGYSFDSDKDVTLIWGY